MFFGNKNARYQYKMTDADVTYCLESTESERDLGIIISNNLKWGNQIKNASNTAYSICCK